MQDLKGHRLITSLTILVLLLPLIGIFWFPAIISIPKMVPHINFIVWLVIAIIFSIIALRQFVLGYLISLFAMTIAWRITGIYNVFIINSILLAGFILMCANFFYCASYNLKQPEQFRQRISLAGWQLIFIRLYLGLNLVPHFTEKLFSGAGPHLEDVSAFILLGVPYPDFFVWLAGLCEFGAAVALVLGFLLRFGALGGAFYLLIATHLGHHFSLGFIWAGAGGGWEFAIMWMVLILSFAFTGYGRIYY